MEESNFSTKIKHRFVFLVKFLFALLFNFLFFIIIKSIFDNFQNLKETTFIISFWLLFMIATSLGIILAYYLITKFIQPQNQPSSPNFKAILTPFVINSANIKDIIQYSLILFFLIYIPIDMIGYFIPKMLEFSAASLLPNTYNNYLTYSLQLMIPIAMIVHFCVAFREEFLIRNYFLVIGQEELKPSTAYIFSAIYFGLAHFNYIFSSGSANYSPFFPIYWGLSATVIGLTAGLVFIKKKMIWPLIFSHWGNNVVSSIALRNHIEGIPYTQTVLQLYLPILIISLLLVIFSFKKIKKGFKAAIDLLKGYKIENLSLPQKEIESKPNIKENLTIPPPQESLSMFILSDIMIIALLWFLSLFLV